MLDFGMVAQPSPPKVSFEEYIAIDAASDVKHEYIGGYVYAMAGGTPGHARIAMTIGGELRAQRVGRPCAVFSSDLRVRVLETGLATYPDVTVVCGKLEVDTADKNTATNPIVLVEVMSKSTEATDREHKYHDYRRIPSLRAYVLVSQEERIVILYTRGADGTWTLRDFQEGKVPLPAIDCSLSLDAVYADPLE